MSHGGGVLVFMLSSLFVQTVIVQTFCIQSVLYSGGVDWSTFLVALLN